MFRRIGWFTLLAVVTLSLQTLSQADSGKGKKSGKVEGTLIGVADNGVVIQTKSGVQVSVGVVATTKVELNDVRVPVTSLPLGARAEAVFDPATLIATKIEAEQ